ncbi:MAG: PQQ-binding-like beta-propeller repeat protein [Opitutaceae bacterium]|nr:PQQ-binding-like beta-propeller repeat protein [Opitutaceae bacterium]
MSAALPLLAPMGFPSWQFWRRPRRAAFALSWLAAFCGAAIALHAQVDGTARWPRPFTAGGRSPSIESSPAVGSDGWVYIGVALNTTPSEGRLLAIDRNGEPKWSVTLPTWVDSSPAISADGTTVYVGCWDGKLYAFAAKDGMPRWTHATGASNYIVSSPAIGADGTIYVGAGDLRTEGAQDSGLYAIAPNGTLRWRKTTGTWVESSPAIAANGTIYFGSVDQNVYALNPDGTEKWKFGASSPIWASPAIGPDGTVYIGAFDGKLYALSPDGGEKWVYATGGSIYGAPAIGADGTIYIGSADFQLHAINPDKSVRWTYAVGGPVLSTPAVRADGSIVFGADDDRSGGIHCVDANGAKVWAIRTSHFVRSSPVVADNSIYAATFDGFIHALHSTAAPLSSFSSWPMFQHDPRHRGMVPPPQGGGRLINLSTRATVSGDTNLIAGFVVRGATAKYYLIRAIGPTLAQFGVSDPLADPTITVQRQSGQIVPGGFNDNWSEEAEPSVTQAGLQLGAFPLPVGSKDAVVLPLLEPAAFTGSVGSTDGGSGTALVEVYEAVSDPGSTLVNLSTRGNVAAGGSIISGLVVRGTGPLRLLIRAVGPSLAQFGVPGVLAQPTLSVYFQQNVIHTNTGWTADGLKGDLAGAARIVGAFPLAENSADCAALLTLNPGDYTIQVSGVGSNFGEVLVEIYAAP